MRFTLCDGTNINSYGFRTNLEGMNLDRFKSNPVMLYSHDTEKVIGRWVNIAIEDGKLRADAEFDNDDVNASAIAGKVERGFLKGCSIGMIIKDMQEIDGILVATVTELMEASICAIPSDSNAIVLYDENRKQLSIDDIKLTFKINNNMADTKEMTELKAQVEELTAQIANRDNEIASRDTRISELEATAAKSTERIAELEAQVAEAHNREIDSYLACAAEKGKISKNEIDSYKKLAASDFETVKNLIDGKTAQASASLAEMAAKSAKTEANKLSWDELDKAGKLAELKASNPEEYKRLFNEKFGK